MSSSHRRRRAVSIRSGTCPLGHNPRTYTRIRRGYLLRPKGVSSRVSPRHRLHSLAAASQQTPQSTSPHHPAGTWPSLPLASVHPLVSSANGCEQVLLHQDVPEEESGVEEDDYQLISAMWKLSKGRWVERMSQIAESFRRDNAVFSIRRHGRTGENTMG